MSKLQKALLARLLLFAAIWLSGCSFFSPPIDISGVWEGEIEWTAYGIRSPITLDLVHEDRDLSGTVTLVGPGSTPFELEIDDGHARISSLSLEASGVFQAGTTQNVTIELEGSFLESQMSGTGRQVVNGTVYELTWEAVLVTPAVPEE